MRNYISKVFQDDQLKLLSGLQKKVPHWCHETILKALKLRFSCGTAGYEELLRQSFPLPSTRTLTKKMENLKFNGGISEEIFQFLHLKVSHFVNSIDCDCLLLLDEMSIKPGAMYDLSSNTYIGYVNLPQHDTNVIATHVLVFMLAGLASRW